jgi:hypothetical protein
MYPSLLAKDMNSDEQVVGTLPRDQCVMGKSHAMKIATRLPVVSIRCEVLTHLAHPTHLTYLT